MNRLSYRRNSLAILFLLSLLSQCVGCARDPRARMNRYFESGLQYAQKGRYREAAIQFQNALQIDRKFAAAHYQLAQCFVHQGLWQNAYRELSFTVDLEPHNLEAHLNIATLLFSVGQFQEARDRTKEILRQDPRHVQALLLLASSDAEIGNVQEAIAEAKQATEIVPDQVAPFLTLGLLQEKTGKISQAEQTYANAVRVDTKSPTARMALAAFYARLGRWPEAESNYQGAISLFPGSPVPRAALADFFLTRGRLDLAEQTLRDAKSAMPDNPAAYSLLGDFYLRTGKLDSALAEFSSLSREHPSDLDAKRRYVSVLVQDGKLDAALAVDAELLKASIADSAALILKGEILTRLHKPEEAIAVLQNVTRSDPENPAAHEQLGVAYASLQRFDDAESEWQSAAKLNPAMLDVQEKLADLAYHKGDLELLQRSGEALLQYAPGSPLGLLVRGTVELAHKNLPNAEKDLRRVLQLDPKNTTALTRLGDLYGFQGDFGKARSCYEQALDIDPHAVEALQNLANLLVAANRKDEALQRVESEVSKTPDEISYDVLLGQILMSQRRFGESESALQKALSLGGANSNARLLLAHVKIALGSAPEAAAIYREMIHDTPKDIRPYIAYGILEEGAGNWQHARDLYQQALDLQNGEPTAANNLSYLLLEHNGDKNYALSLAQIARRAMPDSPSTADTLAWAYYENGIYSSAVDLLQRAVRQSPQNATYRYHLGLIYEKTNKGSLARENLKQALQIDPHFVSADDARTALSRLSRN